MSPTDVLFSSGLSISGAPDARRWKWDASEALSVSSVYHVLDNGGRALTGSKVIWKARQEVLGHRYGCHALEHLDGWKP